MTDSHIGAQENRDRPQRSAKDRAALFLATWGVGYLPLAPGTWGSAVGVGLYLVWERLLPAILGSPANGGAPTMLWISVNLGVLLVVCLSGIWAAGRAAELFGSKDPQRVVGDEVMGQLVTYLFIPFGSSWKILVAGFIFFRIFDIWKPYPIRKFEKLGGGLGICADDLAAGVVAGMLLFVLATFILIP